MYVYVYLCVCRYVYVYICICMYMYVCICMYVCMCLYNILINDSCIAICVFNGKDDFKQF